MMFKFEASKIWRHEHGDLHAKIEISRDQFNFTMELVQKQV